MRDHYRSKPIHPNDVDPGCMNLLLTVVVAVLATAIITFIILALIR